jgi:transposase
VETLYDLARSFVRLMKERDFEALDLWLAKGARCGLPDMQTFTSGLQNEYQAVKNSLLLPYSNGPVEGQVNRLKLVKRSMYGRGSFELLRNRFLEAA